MEVWHFWQDLVLALEAGRQLNAGLVMRITRLRLIAGWFKLKISLGIGYGITFLVLFIK